MATTVKISALTPATSISGSEKLEIVQSGASKSATASQIYSPLVSDLADSSDAAKGAALVGWKQSGTDAVARTVSAKLKDQISILDFISSASVIAGDDVSAALQNAMDAAGALGGGSVWMPPLGKPYYIDSGVTVPEGVWVEGTGRTYHGPPYFGVLEWSDKGTWICPRDLVDPCFTLGYGSGLRGLNFIYDQTEPESGVAYVPITYPYAIKCTNSMFGLDDIWIVNGTHGINIDYPQANGGGTYSWLNNIFLDTLNVGIRWKNVNDTMRISNFHQRALANYDSPEVVAYREANLIGWDVNYLDNLMADGIEFFQCKTAIKLTNSTVSFGAPIGDITQACGYLQLSNVSFNLVAQAMAVTNSSTVGQITMQNVLCQSDITTGAAADWQFDFNANGMEVLITNLWVIFAGKGIARIGGGAGGRLKIGGNLRGSYSGNGAGYNAFSIGASAVCDISCGIHDLSPYTGSAAIFAGAGTPGSQRLTTLYVGQDGRGDIGIQSGTSDRTGFLEWRQAGGTRQGYIGYGVAGQIDINADGANRWNFAQPFSISGLVDYADDAAAATGGVPVGGLYRTSSAIKVRVS